MALPAERPRLLIFVVAYYAEATILEVLRRIPDLEGYETHVLLIDDGSKDKTFDLSDRVRQAGGFKCPMTVLANPANQGYGGNQKLGYHFAIENGFDIVALLHGDAQYAPEVLPGLLEPIASKGADAVLGSRMLVPTDALRGGMPIYKFIGNRILTWYENRVLGSRLSEFHTGYRVYTTAALGRIPFELNSNAFHFDTEIIIQLLRARCRIAEVAIPTHYGGEVCRVNGIRYARDVIVASTTAMLQDYRLVYRRNFDVASESDLAGRYRSKLDFPSTHSEALKEVPPGSVVMDIGCGPGILAEKMRAMGCRVIGIDNHPGAGVSTFDEYLSADLDGENFPRAIGDVNVVLLLDVIEHLRSPEKFCAKLRLLAQDNLGVKIVLSTGNVAFCVTRLMLFLGQFNYNASGILDRTHTRLFTFSSFRRLLGESGFTVERIKGIPAPLPLVMNPGFLRDALMRIQAILIGISRGLFAYQIFLVARPLPTVDTLLRQAERHSSEKSSRAAS
jgi:2-polyprenyl-3-methyl-5-hydroxy-6-metoxy-1,4-benzoquinol methylase